MQDSVVFAFWSGVDTLAVGTRLMLSVRGGLKRISSKDDAYSARQKR